MTPEEFEQVEFNTRDIIALAALLGILASKQYTVPSQIAAKAYEQADAFVAARTP